MSTAVAVAGGLGAAGFFAIGTALQYRAAGEGAAGVEIDARSVARVARATIASSRWLLGTSFLAVGLVLHALALHSGPLTLVQPLLITGVLFALPTSRRAGGPPVTAADMRWAAVLVAALAIFLVTATPASQPAHDIDAGPALATLALSLVGIIACLLVARRCHGSATATVLGIATGIALAGSAALIKVSTDVVTHGLSAVLTSWQLYGLLVVGSSALLLGQLTYRAGPMVAGLPAINTANPLTSVIIGAAVFDERFRLGAGPLIVESLSLVVVLVATATLSRRSHPRRRRSDGPTSNGVASPHRRLRPPSGDHRRAAPTPL